MTVNTKIAAVAVAAALVGGVSGYKIADLGSPASENTAYYRELENNSYANEKTVYVTKHGTKYHTKNCRYVKNAAIAKDYSDVVGKYDPCSVCNP